MRNCIPIFFVAVTVTAGSISAETYSRYTLTPAERQTVFDSARSWWSGKVHDPVSGREIKSTDRWDAGHKPGSEFWRAKDDAIKSGQTAKQFRESQKNLDLYRPELPSSNRSHVGEKPRVPVKSSKVKAISYGLKWLNSL